MKSMYSYSIILLTLVFVALPLSARGKSDDQMQITIYCYDSFNSEWGPGPQIISQFTEETGIAVQVHAPGDAVTVLNQIIFEKDMPKADVVIGIDNSLLQRTLDNQVLIPYESPFLVEIKDKDLIFDTTYHLLPYDYGHFAINYDSQTLENPPKSLEELTKEEYRGKLILMDPRTSSPGLGFLLWTVAVYGENWPDYWQRLKPSILTISEGWSAAYALYTNGEAPMVLSYSTSPVYHLEYEQTTRYKAAQFSDGHVRQIEGMGIVKGTTKSKLARQFIDFMLKESAQRTLAVHNIMLPVRDKISLPDSFQAALKPDKTLVLESQENVEELTSRWTEIF